jgi:hypothetical protein
MTSRSRTVVLLAAVAVVAVAASLRAQGRDAWEGTWKLNTAKSMYGFSPKPEASVSKVEPFEDGWKMSQDTVDTQGLATHVEAFVRFDGKDYRVQGLANATWACISIDDHAYELVSKRNGRFTARTRTVVTPDGNTRVSTTTGTNSEGQIVRNIAIYERQ